MSAYHCGGLREVEEKHQPASSPASSCGGMVLDMEKNHQPASPQASPCAGMVLAVDSLDLLTQYRSVPLADSLANDVPRCQECGHSYDSVLVHPLLKEVPVKPLSLLTPL